MLEPHAHIQEAHVWRSTHDRLHGVCVLSFQAGRQQVGVLAGTWRTDIKINAHESTSPPHLCTLISCSLRRSAGQNPWQPLPYRLRKPQPPLVRMLLA